MRPPAPAERTIPLARTYLQVLLVEDSSADIALIEEFVDELDLPVRLNVVRDGERALRFLRRGGEYAGAPRPDLILLDLNLPACGGLEVLREVREEPDDDLRLIPILVLTTSRSPNDVRDAYRLCANAFVTKPLDPDTLRQVLRSISSFWMQSAQLPGRRTA